MGKLHLFRRGFSFALSVVLAGLQRAYMTKFTSARNLAPDKNPVDNKADIEALGGTVPANTGQVNLGSGTYTGWDWTGYQVMVDGSTKDVHFEGCKFANKNYANGLYAAYGQRLLAIGSIASTQGSNENVTANNCEFDGQGSQPMGVSTGGNAEGVVKAYGDFSATNCWFHDCPKDPVTILCDLWDFERCYFQCPGKIGAGGIYAAPPAEPQHVDNFHIYRGTGRFYECFFDNWDGIPTGLRGSWTTSLFSLQTTAGSGVGIVATVDRCIHRGGDTIIGDGHSLGGDFSGATYTYACDAKTGTTIDLTISNSLLDLGVSGKYASTVLDAGTTFTSTNNRNYTTGAAATLPGGP